MGSLLQEVLDISLQLSEAFEGRQGHSCKQGRAIAHHRALTFENQAPEKYSRDQQLEQNRSVWCLGSPLILPERIQGHPGPEQSSARQLEGAPKGSTLQSLAPYS